MIETKLQTLSKIFVEVVGIPLFSEMPLKELEYLKKDVLNIDTFTLSIKELCNLFDRINKSEIDKYLGNIKSQGSKECLVNLLKKMFIDNNYIINSQIDNNLGMIFLLRAYYIHNKNRNIKKAEEFFEFRFPVDDYSDLWNKVLFCFESTLDIIIELFNNKQIERRLQQNEFEEKMIPLLRFEYIKRNKRIFNSNSVKILLLFLYSHDKITDIELAKEFRYSVLELRELLLPIIPALILPSYVNKHSTLISLTDLGRELIKKIYLKGK